MWLATIVEPVVLDLMALKEFQQCFHAAIDIETEKGDMRAWVPPRLGFEMCRQFDTLDMSIAANVDLPPFESGWMSKAFDSPDIEDFVAVVVG